MDGEESDEPERGFLWTLAIARASASATTAKWCKGTRLAGDATRIGRRRESRLHAFRSGHADQKRADVWIAELQRFVRDGNMPQLEVMWLPMDHLAAARPGKCTPRACMADNDLALGRIVQALSHSPYWKDTVIFVR